MKKRMVRAFVVSCLVGAMLAGTVVTASAAQSNQQEIEAFANWLNGLTVTQMQPGQPTSPTNPTTPANPAAPAQTAPTRLTEDELKAHTDKMFELVNQEREKAGVPPLVRDTLLDEAAMIRATEIQTVDIAGGAPHTRPDGTSYTTLLDEMGVNGSRCGENISRARATPQDAVNAWMQSDGHRRNILRENYASIGIGVYQRPDGRITWIQIFELK